MTSPELEITWRPRPAPLSPAGVAGFGPAAVRLADRLLREEDASLLAQLRGVADREVIVLLGLEEHLPWVDGVVYLGRDAEAPSLLVPATLAPSVPIALLERAVLRRVPRGAVPVALLPSAGAPVRCARVVPVSGARPVSRRRVESWRGDGGTA